MASDPGAQGGSCLVSPRNRKAYMPHRKHAGTHDGCPQLLVETDE
ncbi:hypothetical protein [Desulfoglaeba alkanexedens]|nr:hypothetical protein [Desulfoglaeba alkanexedens]